MFFPRLPARRKTFKPFCAAGSDAYKKWAASTGWLPTAYPPEKTWAVVDNLEKIFKGLAPSVKAAQAEEKANK